MDRPPRGTPLTKITPYKVFAEHLLKEDAPGYRVVEDLRERELRLQDRQLITIAGGTIAWRKRIGNRRSHLRSSRSIFSALSSSASRCSSLGLRQDLIPLSRASNATPRLASWRFRYTRASSCALPT